MSNRPTLLPTSTQNETFAGLTYHLEGELVPVLTVEMTPEHPIFFEHHVLLWKHPQVTITTRPAAGAIKRMFAGMQIFITQANGEGQIAFSRDGAGHIFAVHLSYGQEIDVREHQFLAASHNIDYTFNRVKGFSNLVVGNSGLFIDRFRAAEGDGIVWLHGYGNVFEKNLEAGEQIDIEPGGWLYKDPEVKMETTVQRLSSGLFAGSNLITNRFTGPGRVGIQSMYFATPRAR